MVVKRKRFRTLWLERSYNAILFSCRFHDALNYRTVKQCAIGLKFYNDAMSCVQINYFVRGGVVD